MSEILIKAEHVSKKFSRSLKRSLWYGMQDVMHSLNPFVHDTELESDAFKQKELRTGEFWALQDINFEVRRGECLGLIGHNGAGKSTMLKILNSLLRPDSGRITMKGRVGALIELSAGFNPILSGRENIYNQAALLGFNRRDTTRKFDAIVDFSEMEEFLDMPFQNYSSGMKVKLGFAVSSQLEPDILIIDEVLAVGDLGFRFKCLNKILELINQCAVIFVSHAMPQIVRVCNQVMLMDHGKMIYHSADVATGVQNYFSMFKNESENITGSGEATVIAMKMCSPHCNGKIGDVVNIEHGQSLDLRAELKLASSVREARVQFLFWNTEVLPVLDIMDEDLRGFRFIVPDNGLYTVSCQVSSIPLSAGRYTLSVIVIETKNESVLCRHDNVAVLNVRADCASGAHSIVSAIWSGSAETPRVAFAESFDQKGGSK